jgi:hypothetical protein
MAPPAAPAPAYYPANQPVQSYAGPQQTDGKAVGSLILGIFALFPLGLLAGIPAVILGHLSRKSIRESLGRLKGDKGDGMAVAGLVMGYLSVAALPLVLIIAAIAIPSLIRARIAANEQAARYQVRTVNTDQVVYANDHPDAGYARSLAVLGPGTPPVDCSVASNATSEHACLIDAALGCSSAVWCNKGNYRFNLTGICDTETHCTGYVITATPANVNTGSRNFCSTDDGVVRYQRGSPLIVPLQTAEECKSWLPLQ